MNELEAKCYLTKKGGANNSDHTCSVLHEYSFIATVLFRSFSLLANYVVTCRPRIFKNEVFLCNSYNVIRYNKHALKLHND